MYHSSIYNTGCLKKSFTNLKAYRNLYIGHTQRFELSKCSKTHRILPRIVIRNCFDLFFRFLLHGKKEVEMELDSAAI
jgi:3-methyladenine DNA glycosylase Mpg